MKGQRCQQSQRANQLAAGCLGLSIRPTSPASSKHIVLSLAAVWLLPQFVVLLREWCPGHSSEWLSLSAGELRNLRCHRYSSSPPTPWEGGVCSLVTHFFICGWRGGERGCVGGRVGECGGVRAEEITHSVLSPPPTPPMTLLGKNSLSLRTASTGCANSCPLQLQALLRPPGSAPRFQDIETEYHVYHSFPSSPVFCSSAKLSLRSSQVQRLCEYAGFSDYSKDGQERRMLSHVSPGPLPPTESLNISCTLKPFPVPGSSGWSKRASPL